MAKKDATREKVAELTRAVRFITSPGGEEMALMSRAHFEGLMARLEEVADVRSAKEVLGRVRRGKEEIYPGELVARIVAGKENPIRLWRDHRAMTAEKLAKAAGISRAYLTQIENGSRKGPMELYAKLARILDVEIEMLLPSRRIRGRKAA